MTNAIITADVIDRALRVGDLVRLAAITHQLQADLVSCRATIIAYEAYPHERSWSKRKTVAQMLNETFGTGASFAVWQSADGERRVYIDVCDRDVRESRKIVYYVTGSVYKAPGSIELPGTCYVWKFLPNSHRSVKTDEVSFDVTDRRSIAIVIARHIASTWRRLPTTACINALEFEGETDPLPLEFIDARRSSNDHARSRTGMRP